MDHLPLIASSDDTDTNGKIYLDSRYKDWLSINKSAPYSISLQQQASDNLRIVSPAHHSTYVLDPDLPSQGKFLELKSSSNNKTTWSSNSLEIEIRNGKAIAILQPGTHSISVKDSFTQHQETITFHVKKL